MLLAFGRLPDRRAARPGQPGAAGHAARGDLRGAAGQADRPADPRGAGGRAALARRAARRRRRPRPPHRAGGRAAAPAGRVDAPRLAALERADLDGPAGQAGRGRPGVRDDPCPPRSTARPLPPIRPLSAGRARPARPRRASPGPAGCGCGCRGCSSPPTPDRRRRQLRFAPAVDGSRVLGAGGDRTGRGRRRRSPGPTSARWPPSRAGSRSSCAAAPGRGAPGHARRPATSNAELQASRAAGSWPRRRPSGGGSSATCTTAPSSTSSRSRSGCGCCATACRRRVHRRPRAARRARPRRPRGRRRAAQPRARHLPAAAARRRAGRGAAGGGGPQPARRHGARRTAGPPSRAGRGGGVLLLPGGAAERGKHAPGAAVTIGLRRRAGRAALQRRRRRPRLRPAPDPGRRGPVEHGRPDRRAGRRGRVALGAGCGDPVVGRTPVPQVAPVPGPRRRRPACPRPARGPGRTEGLTWPPTTGPPSPPMAAGRGAARRRPRRPRRAAHPLARPGRPGAAARAGRRRRARGDRGRRRPHGHGLPAPRGRDRPRRRAGAAAGRAHDRLRRRAAACPACRQLDAGHLGRAGQHPGGAVRLAQRGPGPSARPRPPGGHRGPGSRAPDAADELLAGEPAAAALGLHVGDEVILRLLLPAEIARFSQGFGEPDGGFARVRVVGIARAPAWADPVTGLVVTPAFARAHAADVAGRGVFVRLRSTDPATREAFASALAAATAADPTPSPLDAAWRPSRVPDLRDRPDGAGGAARPAGRARRVRRRRGARRAARGRAGPAAPPRRAARRAADRTRAGADPGRARGGAGARRLGRRAGRGRRRGRRSRSPRAARAAGQPGPVRADAGVPGAVGDRPARRAGARGAVRGDDRGRRGGGGGPAPGRRPGRRPRATPGWAGCRPCCSGSAWPGAGRGRRAVPAHRRDGRRAGAGGDRDRRDRHVRRRACSGWSTPPQRYGRGADLTVVDAREPDVAELVADRRVAALDVDDERAGDPRRRRGAGHAAVGRAPQGRAARRDGRRAARPRARRDRARAADGGPAGRRRRRHRRGAAGQPGRRCRSR